MAIQAPGALAAALVEALPRLCAPGSAGSADPRLAQLIAALAAALERGELELDLAGPLPPGLDQQHWPGGYRQALAATMLVATEAQLEQRPEAPLVLAGSALRWRRWHEQQSRVIETLLELACRPVEPPAAADRQQQLLAAAAAQGLDQRQQQAVEASLRWQLVLLGGGPGTGKTSTVVQVLAAALALQPDLRLQLAAPTGKAAARLQEAIASGADRCPAALADQLRQVPCSTLHRLLESNGERFGRDRRRPLGLDLLVVDEVSMVDLQLMAALLEALPPRCRLLLVGDPAQLPPVSPGAVLQELHRPQRWRALGEAAVELDRVYRNAGAIAAAAGVLRQPAAAVGDAAEGAAAAQLQSCLEALKPEDNLDWQRHSPRRLPPPVLERLRRHQQQLAQLARQPADQAALLTELERCILLSPRRQGPWGVQAVQRSLLGEQALRPLAAWPIGTPVLNTRNQGDQGLANGDVGVLVEREGERLVLFPGGRLFHPARLVGAEPAMALTVHKAQGSEYAEVLLLLPEGLLTDPRLLYTGLTRARQRATLITPEETGRAG